MENTRTEQRDLRELWSAARETLAAAQEQAAAAKECTARGALPDGAMVRSLVEALQRYAAQYQALQEAGVPLRGNAQEVEEFLDVCEKRQLDARVQAYFGLTAKDARVRESLEASKRALARLCGAPQTASASALNPFALAADSVRNGLRPLSEADFEAIEAAMGKSIARAVDNGSLLWQENAVVALGREEPREAPIPAIEPFRNTRRGMRWKDMWMTRAPLLLGRWRPRPPARSFSGFCARRRPPRNCCAGWRTKKCFRARARKRLLSGWLGNACERRDTRCSPI